MTSSSSKSSTHAKCSYLKVLGESVGVTLMAVVEASFLGGIVDPYITHQLVTNDYMR